MGIARKQFSFDKSAGDDIAELAPGQKAQAQGQRLASVHAQGREGADRSCEEATFHSHTNAA